jgi:hypothetical protein
MRVCIVGFLTESKNHSHFQRAGFRTVCAISGAQFRQKFIYLNAGVRISEDTPNLWKNSARAENSGESKGLYASPKKWPTGATEKSPRVPSKVARWGQGFGTKKGRPTPARSERGRPAEGIMGESPEGPSPVARIRRSSARPLGRCGPRRSSIRSSGTG